MRCGSYHCRGDHHWIHKGTVYSKLNAINCGATGNISQDKLDIYNSLKYAKQLYEKLCSPRKAK